MGLEKRTTEAQNEETREGTDAQPCRGVRAWLLGQERLTKRGWLSGGLVRPSADTWTPRVWVPRRGQEGKAWSQVQLRVAEMPEEEKG